MKKKNLIANDLPQFSKIQIDAVENNIQARIEKNLATVDDLLKNHSQTVAWENFMYPLEEMEDKLHQEWSPIHHMNSVVNSPALREVYNACLPKLTDYATQLRQNEALYQAVLTLQKSEVFLSFDQAQKTILKNEIRDFTLAGVALAEDKKQQFADLTKKLSQLTTKFEENVLDATQHWYLHITESQALTGIPEHAIAAAAALASQANKEGWIFTLEYPSYYAVITYADNQEIRQQIYTAYVTRASDQGPNANRWDNSSVMQEILIARQQLAQLLNFDNYAQYSLATKMLKTTQQVLDFLQQLINASFPQARQEMKALTEFAKKQHGIENLQAWDVPYYSEKLRQQKYAISQEELRPYFPENKVVNGLFAIVHKLFAISITPLLDADVWHPDARCYILHNADDEVIGYFYLDLYARENKRTGAWMDDCRGRRRLSNGNSQTPIAYITCNFNAPLNDRPALFSHDEVVTLFHEFGHALQHLLTSVNYLEVSGINGVPWDAVEIASQFLENWAWEKESMPFISGHYLTQETLPDLLWQKMLRARNFQSALQMMRQLEFALYDFRLHREFDPQQKNQAQTILNEIRQQSALVPVPEFNRFQHAFTHIFAGGYAAGYYSYKWAEVMAADAFSLFQEKGVFDEESSQRFLTTFLQSGGVVDPMELFIRFRGRTPDINALLRQLGMRAEVGEGYSIF